MYIYAVQNKLYTIGRVVLVNPTIKSFIINNLIIVQLLC